PAAIQTDPSAAIAVAVGSLEPGGTLHSRAEPSGATAATASRYCSGTHTVPSVACDSCSPSSLVGSAYSVAVPSGITWSTRSRPVPSTHADEPSRSSATPTGLVPERRANPGVGELAGSRRSCVRVTGSG